MNLLARVRLDQHRHIEGVGQIEQRPELGIIQCRDDEQHQIGAMGACLPDLIFGDDEILTEHRNMHGSADLVQIIKRAKETTSLGKYGNRACPTALILPGQRRRIGDIAEVALGRRGPLDFGNDRNAIRFLQPSARIDRRRSLGHLPLQFVERHALLTCLLVFDGSCHQFIEYRHGVPFSDLLDW